MGFLRRFAQGVAATWDVASHYGSCEENQYALLHLSSRRLRVQRRAVQKDRAQSALFGDGYGCACLLDNSALKKAYNIPPPQKHTIL